MKKQVIAAWLILLLIFVCLPGCAHDESIYDEEFSDVVQTYIAYKELAMTNWQDAVRQYCYFDDEDALKKTLEGTPIYSYEIIRVEKYSDLLWEIEFFSNAAYNPQGAYGVNYVAKIDGKYRVIINLRWVPEEILEGLEIEPYVPHGPGVVGYEDVIDDTVELPEK